MRALFYMTLCPFSRAARMALTEKGLMAELVLENAWDMHPEFLAMNPSGEIPALVEDDGTVVAGGYAVLEYLEDICPQRPLFGVTTPARAEVRRLIEWFNTRFNDEVTRKVVFEKAYKKLMQQGEPDSTTIREGKRSLPYHLDYITNLVRARGWLAGDSLSMADIVAAAHLSCLDYLGDIAWEGRPHVREWYGLMKSRPSLRALLPERVAFFRPPAYYEDPDF